MRGFWGEVNVFLRESVELFYWSLWWPSKIEAKIGSLSESAVLTPGEKFDARIFCQFIFLILFFSIPLALLIIEQGRLIDWLFSIYTPFIAYGIETWFFPATFSVPILIFTTYLQNPELSYKEWIDPASILDVLLTPLSYIYPWAWRLLLLSLIIALFIIVLDPIKFRFRLIGGGDWKDPSNRRLEDIRKIISLLVNFLLVGLGLGLAISIFRTRYHIF